MLKVAAMAKADDEQPKLIDVDEAKRAPRAAKSAGKKPPPRAMKGSKPRRSPEPPAEMITEPINPPEMKPTKPRMRLVYGKLAPVDDGQGLF